MNLIDFNSLDFLLYVYYTESPAISKQEYSFLNKLAKNNLIVFEKTKKSYHFTQKGVTLLFHLSQIRNLIEHNGR